MKEKKKKAKQIHCIIKFFSSHIFIVSTFQKVTEKRI